MIVKLYVPIGVISNVDTVSVDVAGNVTVAGLKLAVAPEGKPLVLYVTGPANPPVGVTVGE
jgi:hypothetical protein